jgi:hypothetical protein
MIVLTTRSECVVPVQCEAPGLRFLQARLRDNATGVHMANGVAEILPNKPFPIRVVNTSMKTRRLPKGMVLGHALPHPTAMAALIEDSEYVKVSGTSTTPPSGALKDFTAGDHGLEREELSSMEYVIDPWTRVHAFYHVYTSSLHLSMILSHEITPDPIEPRHCILDFGPVILHMATLHHTTFSPHIRSIVTSVFGRTTYQINTSL